MGHPATRLRIYAHLLRINLMNFEDLSVRIRGLFLIERRLLSIIANLDFSQSDV